MGDWNEERWVWKVGGFQSREVVVFHVWLEPSGGRLGNYFSKLNVTHSFTGSFSSIHVSLMSIRLGFEVLLGLTTESEPHSGKWQSWHSKSGLSKSKAHTRLLWRSRFIYLPIDVQCSSIICWKLCPSSNELLLYLCKNKSVGNICVSLFLGSLLCSFDHVSIHLTILHSLDCCSFIL